MPFLLKKELYLGCVYIMYRFEERVSTHAILAW